MTNKVTNVEELMSTLETMRAAQREFANLHKNKLMSYSIKQQWRLITYVFH